MKREQLFGGFLADKAAAEIERQQEAARQAEQTAAEQRARERLKAPLTALASRNQAIVRGAGALAAGSGPWNLGGKQVAGRYDNNIIGTSVLVALGGQVPKTLITPDHAAVCVVGLLHSDLHNKYQHAHFTFAHVPKQAIEQYHEAGGRSAYPYLDPKTSVVSQMETSLSQVMDDHKIEYALYGSGRKRQKQLDQLAASLQRVIAPLEENLHWVSEVAEDGNLNPHLTQLQAGISLQS